MLGLMLTRLESIPGSLNVLWVVKIAVHVADNTRLAVMPSLHEQCMPGPHAALLDMHVLLPKAFGGLLGTSPRQHACSGISWAERTLCFFKAWMHADVVPQPSVS